MPLKSKAQAAWMKRNHPTMYEKWKKHTSKEELNRLPLRARQDAAKEQLKNKKSEV
tara:strand:- start:151 stop:318 length:168 start_codon:yes stop_codon:yes gene_type:complete